MRRPWSLFIIPLIVCLTILLCAGCGGGKDGGPILPPDPPEQDSAKVKLSIVWAARSKQLAAPGSAQSCRVSFYPPAQVGGLPTASWVIQRRSDPAAYNEVWESPVAISAQPWRLLVRFYSEASGNGNIVASADQLFTLAFDGSGADDISLTGRITSVDVTPAGTPFDVGEKRTLTYTARDAQQAVVPVSPGSVFWAVASGSDVLRIIDGELEALKTGNATVTATIDGITSAPVSVSVNVIMVSLDSETVILSPGETHQFTSTVTGAVNTGVAWSVAEGAAGGTVYNGFYTAPSTPGRYTVTATSLVDNTRSDSTAVTVVADEFIAYSYKIQQIYIAEPDGSQRRLVAAGNWPSISPDGQLIVYQNYQSQISLCRPDGTVPEGIGTFETGSQPMFNLDGTRILYLRNGSFVSVKLDGTDRREIYQGGGSYLSFFPDGRIIFQSMIEGGQTYLAIINGDGSGYQPLINSKASLRYPAVSPDGQTIAVYVSYLDSHDGTNGIYLMNIDGSNQRLIATDIRTDRLTFSPDGTKVIFSNCYGTRGYIAMANVNGPNGPYAEPVSTDYDFEVTWWKRKAP